MGINLRDFQCDPMLGYINSSVVLMASLYIALLICESGSTHGYHCILLPNRVHRIGSHN